MFEPWAEARSPGNREYEHGSRLSGPTVSVDPGVLIMGLPISRGATTPQLLDIDFLTNLATLTTPGPSFENKRRQLHGRVRRQGPHSDLHGSPEHPRSAFPRAGAPRRPPRHPPFARDARGLNVTRRHALPECVLIRRTPASIHRANDDPAPAHTTDEETLRSGLLAESTPPPLAAPAGRRA